jgi:CheY-like chemotaxis protein
MIRSKSFFKLLIKREYLIFFINCCKKTTNHLINILQRLDNILNHSYFPKSGVWVDFYVEKFENQHITIRNIYPEISGIQELLGLDSIQKQLNFQNMANYSVFEADLCHMGKQLTQRYTTSVKYFKRINHFVWSLEHHSINGEEIYLRFRVLNNPFVTNHLNNIQLPEANSLQNLSILLLEKNEVSSIIFRKQFELLSLKVDLCRDIESAFQKITNTNYHFIVIDLHVHQLDAFVLCKKIRSHSDSLNKNTPLIGTTTNSFSEVKDLIFESGMNDCLHKPYKPSELKEKLLQFIVH